MGDMSIKLQDSVNLNANFDEEYPDYIADQNYDPTSKNAQSGIAVKQAVDGVNTRVNNEFTNALKGNKSGSVFLIDDVSPVTHEMDVKVRNKNLIPYPYYETTKTTNGVTFTVNKDGSITANGTATAQAYFKLQQSFSLKKGQYFFSGCPTGGAGSTYSLYLSTSDYIFYKPDVGNGIFINSEDDKTVLMIINIAKDTTVENLIFKPQLELGTTATAYTPYVPDLTAVKVTRCGKNLFDTINAVKLNGASSFSVTNHTITVSQNKNYNYTSANVLISKSLVGKIITLSAKSKTSGANVAGLRIQWVSDSAGATGDMILGRPDSAGNIVVTGTVPTQPDETHNNLCLMFYSNSTGTLETGTTYTATYSDIQIELGSTVTDYEPYKECAEYTPTADGTVNGVTSLYPNTTLMTDTDGVIIDCEYSRDINKAFAELQQAIISLGGNV